MLKHLNNELPVLIIIKGMRLPDRDDKYPNCEALPEQEREEDAFRFRLKLSEALGLSESLVVPKDALTKRDHVCIQAYIASKFGNGQFDGVNADITYWKNFVAAQVSLFGEGVKDLTLAKLMEKV